MDPAARATPVLERSRALTAALQTLAGTLAAGDPVAVLDCESTLAAALAPRVATGAPLTPADREALRLEIQRTRAALLRCRSLGATHRHLTDATLAALGRHGSYGPQGGASTPRPTRGLDLRARG
jgi:hypothetical protein